MNENDLTPSEKAGKAAADCLMPAMIAAAMQPSDQLDELAAGHAAAHWQKLDDDGKLAAFMYLASVLAVTAAEKAKRLIKSGVLDGLADVLDGRLRSDGGL